MAIDDLQGVIENLRDMIEVHHDYLSEDETRTRQVLIDPLLRKLGWDVSDPQAVELEYRVGPQRADYALMSNNQPVAVIEAKRLGRDLEDNEMMQVLNYANREGIDYMIVTDGDRWMMYDVFRRGALPDRLLMELQLSQMPTHKNALQALAMWNRNIVSDGSPSKAVEPVFLSSERARDRPDNNPDELPQRWISDNAPIGSEGNYSFASSKRRYPQYTKPIRINIGDQFKKPVKNWKDVIHEVVVWLIEEGMLNNNDCPIEKGRWTFIGLEAVNRDGTPFRRPRQLPGNFILQHGLSTYEQWDGLKKLLKRLKADLSAIQVNYRSTEHTSH